MTVRNNWLVRTGDTCYFGGTAPLDVNGNLVGPNEAAAQTEAIIARYRDALKKQGLGLENIVFITVYLKSLDDYAAMNEAYGRMLPEPYPARKVVQAPMTINGMVVEMTAVAGKEVKVVAGG